MSDHVREVNERDFDQVVLKSRTPVLVDFWAEWSNRAARLPQSLTLSPSNIQPLRASSSSMWITSPVVMER